MVLPVLLLPDWQPQHASHWMHDWAALPACRVLEQHQGVQPLRGDWMARLEEAVLDGPDGQVLVAHGLGCLLVAAWAAYSRQVHRVRAALLVAPCDVQQDALRWVLSSWAQVPQQPLPFPAALWGSDSDGQCSGAQAQRLAQSWGAQWVDCGAVGSLAERQAWAPHSTAAPLVQELKLEGMQTPW